MPGPPSDAAALEKIATTLEQAGGSAEEARKLRERAAAKRAAIDDSQPLHAQIAAGEAAEAAALKDLKEFKGVLLGHLQRITAAKVLGHGKTVVR